VSGLNGEMETFTLAELAAFPARRASFRHVSIVMFRPHWVTKTRASTEMWVPCSNLFHRQIGLRTGCLPKFDEPANGTKIVKRRKRPETNWTEKHQISPIVPEIALLIIASWLINILDHSHPRGARDGRLVMGLVLRELGNHQASDDALAKYAQLQQNSTDARPEHGTQEPLVAPEP